MTVLKNSIHATRSTSSSLVARSGQSTMRSNTRPGFASRSASLGFGVDGKPLSLDEATRSIEFVAATEVPTLVWDWERWDFVLESLLMSGLRLPASGRCVFLDTHSRESVTSVIGSFRDQRVVDGASGRELVGRAYYSSTHDGEAPYIKTVEGHVTDVSIGYEIHAYVWVEEGQKTVIEGREFKGPLRVVTDWSEKEISLCPMGADELAKVRHNASQPEKKAEPKPETSKNKEDNKTNERATIKENTMSKKRRTKRSKGKTASSVITNLRAQLARAERDLARAKLRDAEKEEDERDLLEEDDDHQGSGALSSDSQDNHDDDDEERNDGMNLDDEDDPERGDDGDDDDDRFDEEEDKREEDKDEESRKRKAIKRERARISSIRSICASFGVSSDLEDTYVRKGTSVNMVRKEVMGMLRAERNGPALAGGRRTMKSSLVADAERRAGKGATR